MKSERLQVCDIKSAWRVNWKHLGEVLEAKKFA
jgi:hypothetical protein